MRRRGTAFVIFASVLVVLAVTRQPQTSRILEENIGDPPSVAEENSNSTNGGEVWLKSFHGNFTFPFRSHTGSWYSAASAPSLQWNFKVHRFDGCKPIEGDTFVTGFALTMLNESGQQSHVEVSVVNEYLVDAGCGKQWDKAYEGCLGAGSLELIVDGQKITQPTDHTFGEMRIFAINTISGCARAWFPYRVGGKDLKQSIKTRPHEVVERAGPNTMFDKEGCHQWLKMRRRKKDLMKLPGTHSTILVQTKRISFHIEYNQEQERCRAHHLNVWISKISQQLLDENPWEGIIGETKYLLDHTGKTEQTDVLKHSRAGSYEVISPASLDCPRGCLDRNHMEMTAEAEE